jgi:Tfp pilus assembly protein PilV
MKNFIKKNKIKKGFMMVEVIIATAIMLILVMATMSVVAKVISVSNRSLHFTQSAYLLDEGGEAIRIIRDNSWSNISSASTNTDYYLVFLDNTWTLSTTPVQIDLFTRTVNIFPVNRDTSLGYIVPSGGVLDVGTKLVKINVFWQESGQTISKSLSFYVSDIFP